MSDQEDFAVLLRTDLSLFIQRTFNTLSPAEQYRPNWHIEAIAHHLTLVKDGLITRLVITVPPRHLKSISCSVAFVAWILGHDPSARIICVSYSSQLAEKFSEDTRLVIEQPWYKVPFPGTVISLTKDTKAHFGTTMQGFRLATSVGGPLTGMGGTYIIIDDPHKADDAQSEVRRAQVIAWFKQTVLSRLDDPAKGRIIIIQQRFHESDLAGTVLDEGGWIHLNLPAIAEAPEMVLIAPGKYHYRNIGDVLHPEQVSKEHLEKMRVAMGPYAFAGQYQQAPAPAGGGIVKISWFPRFDLDKFEVQFGDRIIQSWDLAYTVSDLANYSVCTTWVFRKGRLYLIDVFRRRLETPDLTTLIPKHADLFGAQHVVLERTGVGTMLLQKFYRELDPTRQRYLHHAPTEDKVARLHRVAPLIAEGRVLLPEQAPWLPAFIHELEIFPNGKYDDQVDSLSQALLWLWHRGNPPRDSNPNPDGTDGNGAPQSRVTVVSRMPDLTHHDLFNRRIF